MLCCKDLNERAKKLTMVDIALTKWAAFCGAIVIVKIIPQLLNINIIVWIILMLACAIKPFYAFWIKK